MAGSLAHSPADILRYSLIALGLGADPTAVSPTWPIYVGAEPNVPDNVITLYDTEGRSDGRMNPTGERAEHHGIQVRVRAINHTTGYAKARAIAVALDESIVLTTVTISGTTYLIHAVSRTSDVIPLGKDVSTSKRSLFTINALAALVSM